LCPRLLLQIPLFFATVMSYHVLMKAAPAQFVGMTVVGMISFTLINYGSTFLSPSSSSILTAFAICVVRPRAQKQSEYMYSLSQYIHNATSASHLGLNGRLMTALVSSPYPPITDASRTCHLVLCLSVLGRQPVCALDQQPWPHPHPQWRLPHRARVHGRCDTQLIYSYSDLYCIT
jgi:hypothetical protein